MKVITDDSGFLALVDPDAYDGHVGGDWTLDALRALFAREMARRSLLLWGTGEEREWRVEIVIGAAAAAGRRQALGGIVSSKGRLLLTNYESLTMAAQFPDVRLPEAHQRDLLFEITPGGHACQIIQDAAQPQPPVDFIVALEAVSDLPPVWTTVPWAQWETP